MKWIYREGELDPENPCKDLEAPKMKSINYGYIDEMDVIAMESWKEIEKRLDDWQGSDFANRWPGKLEKNEKEKK